MIAWRNYKKGIFLGLIVFVVLLGCTFGNSLPVNAYGYSKGSNRSIDKISAYNLITCWGVLKEKITVGDVSDYFSYPNVVHYSLVTDKGRTVPMPNTVFNGSGSASPTLTCEEFLFGAGDNWSGLVDLSQYKKMADGGGWSLDKINDFLVTLGYEKASASVSGHDSATACLSISTKRLDYNLNVIVSDTTNPLCAEVEDLREGGFGYRVVPGTLVADVSQATGSHRIWLDYREGAIYVGDHTVTGDEWEGTIWKDLCIGNEVCKWEDIQAGAKKVADEYSKIENIEWKVNYEGPNFGDDDIELPINRNTQYNKKSLTTARKNLTGVDEDNSYLTVVETYNIYAKYISNGDYVSMICDDEFDFPDGWLSVRVKRDGKIDNTCHVNYYINSRKSTLYTGADINPATIMDEGRPVAAYYFTNKNLTLADIVKRINAINIEDIIDEIDNVIPNADPSQLTDPDNPEEPDGETDICYANSGALGWIACPIITALQGIGNKMWNQIETYHMVIPASEVFKSGGGVETGWGVVRDIANILFVILFLVVIFSQLTGVGIDNYGVKKILPRLIVVAILVNLSYIICELAVDLSNIFGMGLNNMLSGWAGDLAVAGDEASTGGQVAAWTLTGIFAVGGTFLWGLFSAGSVAGALVWIGLAVLGVAIMIIVAMLFLYLTLIVREAGIVFSIVLAPVAIVCYVLPNTEKLGKKWFDLFKAMLLVYPICGAMIGGGQLAGSILASIDNKGMRLAAAIVQVVPFFFIPMVLRNSLSLMGNVGAKLSSLGRSWGRRGSSLLQNGIKGTNRYKDWSSYQQSQAAARRAQRVRDRLGDRTNLSTRQKDRLRKAEDVLLAQRKREAEDNTRVNTNYFEAMSNKQDLAVQAEADAVERLNDATVLEAERQSMADKARLERSKARTTLAMNQYSGEGLGQLQRRWDAAFSSGNVEELDALTNVISQRYGAAGANSIASSLSNIRGVAGNTNYQSSLRGLQRTMNDNTAFAGFMRSKASDAYQMISEAGTRHDQATGNTVYEDLSYFSANNVTATAAKDWATASAATLQRAVDSGALDAEMMNKLLTSDVPEITAGLQSEKGKRRILEAALYNQQHGTNLSVDDAAAKYNEEKQAIAGAPTMIGHGAYEDPAGNVYHLRQMSDGRYLDDNDFEVDITHFRQH